MRTIIAGSRDIEDRELVYGILDEHAKEISISRVLCGCCRGVDRCGYDWARNHGLPIDFYPAYSDQLEWMNRARRKWELPSRVRPHEMNSKKSGPLRNALMAQDAAVLILIAYKDSRGSLSMLNEAKKRGLKIWTHFIERQK